MGLGWEIISLLVLSQSCLKEVNELVPSKVSRNILLTNSVQWSTSGKLS